MKKTTIYFLLALLVAIFPISILADDNPDGGNNTELIIVPPTTPKKPRIPSNSHINCFYGNGFIELSFPTECEYMEMTLTQNGISAFYGIVTIDEPRIETPLLTGEYIINCKTDGNQYYQGILYF